MNFKELELELLDMQENPKLITRFKEGIKYFENKQGSMEINLLRQCESEFSLEHSSNQLD